MYTPYENAPSGKVEKMSLLKSDGTKAHDLEDVSKVALHPYGNQPDQCVVVEPALSDKKFGSYSLVTLYAHNTSIGPVMFVGYIDSMLHVTVMRIYKDNRTINVRSGLKQEQLRALDHIWDIVQAPLQIARSKRIRINWNLASIVVLAGISCWTLPFTHTPTFTVKNMTLFDLAFYMLLVAMAQLVKDYPNFSTANVFNVVESVMMDLIILYALKISVFCLVIAFDPLGIASLKSLMVWTEWTSPALIIYALFSISPLSHVPWAVWVA